MYRLLNRNSPAQLVRNLAPLNTGQGIIQLVRNLADFAVVDISDIALVAQLADRRDDRSGTGAEYLFQLAFLGCLHDISDRQALLGYRNTPVLEQVDAGAAGDARQNRTDTRSGVNRAVNLEEAVHGTDFLDILMLYAIQPQGLLIAEIMCLDLRDQGCRVVAAALGEAGTARACTGVLVLNEDLNRVDAGGVVCADRRAGAEVIGIQPADSDRAKGVTVAENFIQANPDLTAFAATNDEMALGAYEAVKAAGKEDEITVYGFDGSIGGLESILNGEMTGTAAQDPVQEGYGGVELAVKILEGQDYEKENDNPFQIVTADNAQEVYDDLMADMKAAGF